MLHRLAPLPGAELRNPPVERNAVDPSVRASKTGASACWIGPAVHDSAIEEDFERAVRLVDVASARRHAGS
jgi:hypothetical protein